MDGLRGEEPITVALEWQIGGSLDLTSRLPGFSSTIGGIRLWNVVSVRFGGFFADGQAPFWGPTLGFSLRNAVRRIPGAVYEVPFDVDLHWSPTLNPFDGAWPVHHMIGATFIRIPL